MRKLAIGLLVAVAAIVIVSLARNALNPGNNKAKDADVVVWHWMSDREDTFEELVQRYEALTGVRVEVQVYAPSDAYSSKVRAAAITRTLPDVYGILAEPRDYASFIKAGFVENLTPYLEANEGAWQQSFFSKALSMDTFVEGNQFGVTPGIYGIPTDVMNIQFLYNKDLFKKAGLNPDLPPQTFAEFIEAGKKLKAAGIQGLVSGWAEVWMLNCLADNFAWNLMGKDKILATIRGDVAYTDPDWVRIFSYFQQMGESGVLANGIVSMVNKHAEQIFANEKAAMAFNGSWGVNVYRGMNPRLNYATFLPPKVSDAFPVVIWGGAGSSFKVNAASANKDKAIAFLKWLTEKEQQEYLVASTLNLPANKDALSQDLPILQEFAQSMDRVVHLSQLPRNEYPRVVETMGKGLQLIIIGQKSPEQLAQDLQRVKEEEIKRDSRR